MVCQSLCDVRSRPARFRFRNSIASHWTRVFRRPAYATNFSGKLGAAGPLIRASTAKNGLVDYAARRSRSGFSEGIDRASPSHVPTFHCPHGAEEDHRNAIAS